MCTQTWRRRSNECTKCHCRWTHIHPIQPTKRVYWNQTTSRSTERNHGHPCLFRPNIKSTQVNGIKQQTTIFGINRKQSKKKKVNWKWIAMSKVTPRTDRMTSSVLNQLDRPVTTRPRLFVSILNTNQSKIYVASNWKAATNGGTCRSV